MDQWLITQNGAQFSVDGIDGLKSMVSQGKLSAADMVQRPGTDEWHYASEISELKEIFPSSSNLSDDDDLDEYGAKGGGLKTAMAALLVAIVCVGGYFMFSSYDALQTDPGRIVGKGGMSYSEMLVTKDGAPLLSSVKKGASAKTTLAQNSTLNLLGKRMGSEYYHAQVPNGPDGYVKVDHVVPAYMIGGKKAREEFDPLYNPDRFVDVQNASWYQVDQRHSQLTVFQFQLYNKSRYPMTDVLLMATVKDARGNEIERIEIPVEGEIPAWRGTMVGTLEPSRQEMRNDPDIKARLITTDLYEEIMEDDPDIALRYKDGVEVEMQSKDFIAAEIDLLQLRAIPEAEPKPRRR